MLRNNCLSCAIRDRAICQALPDAALVQLNQMARRRTVKAGQRISEDGADLPMVANIVSGVVRLSKSLADGRTQIVGLMFPTDFLGRPFSAGGGVMAEAATNVVLCYFTQRQMEQLLVNHGDLQQLFVRRTIEQLDAARDWMLLLGRKTAIERVASFILLCADKMHPEDCHSEGRAAPVPVELPLSRTETADFLGLTLETVGRMIKKLETAGLIENHSNRSLTIRHRERLVRQAEPEQL
jgi:CRP/FNR family transcriptional regulator